MFSQSAAPVASHYHRFQKQCGGKQVNYQVLHLSSVRIAGAISTSKIVMSLSGTQCSKSFIPRRCLQDLRFHGHIRTRHKISSFDKLDEISYATGIRI